MIDRVIDRERVEVALAYTKAYGRLAKELPHLLPPSPTSPAWMLRRNVERHGWRPALLFEDRRFNWYDLDAQANRYAHAFRRRGIRAGDVVAVMMDNRPELLFAQLGLSKLGAVTALINTHIEDKPLIHAIRAARPKAVLVGSEHAAQIAASREDLDVPADRVLCDVEGEAGAHGLSPFNEEVQRSQFDEPHFTHRHKGSEPSAYIYTSGTTGLPKPAVITNQRFTMASAAFGRMAHEVAPGDVVYVTLPLYHSSGQWVGWGACLYTGAAMALRRKFSASRFWDDVHRYGATRFTYIGELCRYLLNQPVRDNERGHYIQMAVGNGLRPDIWEEFQRRFEVPLVREFYGATEGNAPMLNVVGRPGMVGRLGAGQVVVRADLETGELERDARGFCTEVEEGETGVLLGKITRLHKFDGYVDTEATRKKIVTHVFKKNDCYFNSGDLMTLHENRWVSFADRLGDTFRWKGENVSTNEVAEVLNGARGVLESNVYGVRVPGAEGRAGMAALNVGSDFDLDDFAHFVTQKLPGYQRPYFIRVQHGMQTTGTLKHQKVDYRKQGFDPSKVDDPLYFWDGDRYVPLDQGLYERITRGEIRL